MTNKHLKNSVREWIRENNEQLVKLTQGLVRIPSISGDELKIQEFIHKFLKDMKLKPEMIYPDLEILRKDVDYFETTSFSRVGYKNRPNVATTLTGSGDGRSICLTGHVDVVSPEPLEGWTRDPWGGEVEDDLLYGRGSGDMKAGIAAMFIAVQAIQEQDVELMGDVQLETTIEEEDGGVGGNLFLRLVRPKVDAAINPEPTMHNLGVASGGVMYFRVTVKGVPAHAATAHFGVNAIEKMMLVVNALRDLNSKRQRTTSFKIVEESDPRMKGHVTTINIGTISSGDWPSTVPAKAILESRIGWPPGETREEVQKQVEEAVSEVTKSDPWLSENPPIVDWFGWYARPHVLDLESDFIHLMKRNITEVVGVTPKFAGGSAGLDTRFFAHRSIPAVTFGPETQRIHSFDEWVSIESTLKTAETIATTLIDWCGV
ncbi:MAG: ArgE/DapE family deacylase [Candidatus Thorarchaeota archaeon]|nr:ArgE/DapE family deacylase [Candidatus Thorarchaeota archaeon]